MDRCDRSARMCELSWFAIECSRATCAGARGDDRSVHKSFGQRSGAEDRQVKIHRNAANDRRRSDSRNSAALAIYGKRRARLSRAWTVCENIERRRITANPIGGPTRVEFAWRALRFGRADHRPAPARQLAFARHAHGAARKRKLARHRRARRRNDAARRSHCRSWPARRSSRRRSRCHRNVARHRTFKEFRDRSVFEKAAVSSDARVAAVIADG